MQEGSIIRYAENNQTWDLTIPDGYPIQAVLFSSDGKVAAAERTPFKNKNNSGRHE
jgi:hypothetical protein